MKRIPTPGTAAMILCLSLTTYSTAHAESYVFHLSKMRIDKTRARHNDTLYANATVKVGGAVTGPVSKFRGDKNDGTHAIGLSVGPFDVNDPNAVVRLEYQIVNKGHGGKGETAVENLLKTVAAEVAASALANAPGAVAIMIARKLGLDGLINPDCDGPVAIAEIEVTGAMLREWTASGPHVEDRFDAGYESANGCGGNSKYTVTWAVERTSAGPRPRPDLNGLRVKGSRAEQYLMDQGCRRHIPDIPTRDRLFRDEAFEPIAQNEIDTICEGPPISRDARLVRAPGQKEVYLLDAGVKRHITSPAAMDKYRFAWDHIQSISPSQVAQIPVGIGIE